MSEHNLGLGPFLQALDEALAGRSADELRAILLDQAQRLPASDRGAFLAMFEQRNSPAQAAENQDAHLAQDVEKFAADVADETYYQAWGYDDEYGDERGYGDESWTIEFDALADRAAYAFLQDDVALARKAYRGLLKAINDDEGSLPGAGLPDELLQTDLSEAKHRYLRAVWDDESPATRAAALLAADSEVGYVGPAFTLEGLDAARRERLPDEATVLADLIGLLISDPDASGRRVLGRRLLTEAVERLHGPDGLADLARTPGDDQPTAYRDWIDALARDGRIDDAGHAATEALERLDHGGPTVAAVARRGATLAAVHGDVSGVLDARLAAWRADPTLPGLVELADAAAAVGRRDAVMADEARRADEPPLSERPSLAAATLILGGRTDDAAALFTAGTNHNRGIRPGADVAVLPVLLIGASDAMEQLHWPTSTLATLLGGANSARGSYRYVGPADDVPDAIASAVPDEVRDDFFRTHADDDLSLADMLADALVRQPPSSTQRAAWLTLAQDNIAKELSSIVSGKHRSWYPHAAVLVAACAEALLLTSGTATAHEYVADARARYPRHIAFKRELHKAVASSPLLSAAHVTV